MSNFLASVEVVHCCCRGLMAPVDQPLTSPAVRYIQASIGWVMVLMDTGEMSGVNKLRGARCAQAGETEQEVVRLVEDLHRHSAQLAQHCSRLQGPPATLAAVQGLWCAPRHRLPPPLPPAIWSPRYVHHT